MSPIIATIACLVAAAPAAADNDAIGYPVLAGAEDEEILFLVLQRHYVQGFTSGAVRG